MHVIPVPDSNSTWEEVDERIHDHRDKLLAEHNEQEDAERKLFREYTGSYMMSSLLDWCREVLKDRHDRIKNATAITPGHDRSMEIHANAVMKDKYLSFLTNTGNTRSQDYNSTINELQDLDSLLGNLTAQKNILERIHILEKYNLIINQLFIGLIKIQRYQIRTRM